MTCDYDDSTINIVMGIIIIINTHHIISLLCIFSVHHVVCPAVLKPFNILYLYVLITQGVDTPHVHVNCDFTG